MFPNTLRQPVPAMVPATVLNEMLSRSIYFCRQKWCVQTLHGLMGSVCLYCFSCNPTRIAPCHCAGAAVQRGWMLAGIACSSGASGGVRTSAGSRPTRNSAELPPCDRTLKRCYNTPRYLLHHIKHMYAFCCFTAFDCSRAARCSWAAYSCLHVMHQCASVCS